MAEAEPVIGAVLPDVNVPTSIRSSDVPVLHGSAGDLGSILDTWLATNAGGVACVIGAGDIDDDAFQRTARVRSLTPELSKGLSSTSSSWSTRRRSAWASKEQSTAMSR